MLWYTWKARNALVFIGDDVPRLSRMVCSTSTEAAKKRLPPILHALGVSPYSSLPSVWYPPEVNWLTLNTDAVAKGQDCTVASGGIIKDSSGMHVRSFGFHRGRCDPLSVELWATHKGLEIAIRENYKMVIIQTDSALGHQLLTTTCPEMHPNLYLIHDCSCLLSSFGFSFKLQHIRHCKLGC